MPGRQAQKTLAHIHHIYMYTKRKSNLFPNWKYGVEKMVCLVSDITILNLEHKPKASRTQINVVGL